MLGLLHDLAGGRRGVQAAAAGIARLPQVVCHQQPAGRQRCGSAPTLRECRPLCILLGPPVRLGASRDWTGQASKLSAAAKHRISHLRHSHHSTKDLLQRHPTPASPSQLPRTLSFEPRQCLNPILMPPHTCISSQMRRAYSSGVSYSSACQSPPLYLRAGMRIGCAGKISRPTAQPGHKNISLPEA